MKSKPGSYPRGIIKLVRNSKVIDYTYSKHLKHLGYFIRTSQLDFDKAYIKVIYKPGWHNDGWYTNKEDLLWAYQAFTEADLVRTIQGFV